MRAVVCPVDIVSTKVDGSDTVVRCPESIARGRSEVFEELLSLVGERRDVWRDVDELIIDRGPASCKVVDEQVVRGRVDNFAHPIDAIIGSLARKRRISNRVACGWVCAVNVKANCAQRVSAVSTLAILCTWQIDARTIRKGSDLLRPELQPAAKAPVVALKAFQFTHV